MAKIGGKWSKILFSDLDHENTPVIVETRLRGYSGLRTYLSSKTCLNFKNYTFIGEKKNGQNALKYP